MEKSVAPHVFPVDAKVTRSITLKDLVKSGEESPFPALTQIEVYGRVRDAGEAFSKKRVDERGVIRYNDIVDTKECPKCGCSFCFFGRKLIL